MLAAGACCRWGRSADWWLPRPIRRRDRRRHDTPTPVRHVSAPNGAKRASSQPEVPPITNPPGTTAFAGCAAHREAGAHTMIRVMRKGLSTIDGLHRLCVRARRVAQTTMGRNDMRWQWHSGFVMVYTR